MPGAATIHTAVPTSSAKQTVETSRPATAARSRTGPVKHASGMTTPVRAIDTVLEGFTTESSSRSARATTSARTSASGGATRGRKIRSWKMKAAICRGTNQALSATRTKRGSSATATSPT